MRYVVYRFSQKEAQDIDNALNIQTITTATHYELPEEAANSRCVYMVTALDKMQNESSPVKVKVRF